jgi:hypothetical protein
MPNGIIPCPFNNGADLDGGNPWKNENDNRA